VHYGTVVDEIGLERMLVISLVIDRIIGPALHAKDSACDHAVGGIALDRVGRTLSIIQILAFYSSTVDVIGRFYPRNRK